MKKTILNSVGERYDLFFRLKAASIKLKAVTFILPIINYLKLLWKGFLDRKAYRNDVQKRLFKQRALKRERASTPLSQSGDGHWTDRFLKAAKPDIAFTTFTWPLLMPIANWKWVFPLCLLLVLLAYMPVMARKDLRLGRDSITALKVGDKVPDLLLENIINYKSTSAKLSDFKGKLLILDFWATWCGSCISKLAEDEALQDEFSCKLVFLLVNSKDTGDSLLNATSFLNKWQKSHSLKLNSPMIFEDHVLNQYFPRTALPHYVWIDGSGKVRAITRKEFVNSENIIKALQLDEFNFPIKTF